MYLFSRNKSVAPVNLRLQNSETSRSKVMMYSYSTKAAKKVSPISLTTSWNSSRRGHTDPSKRKIQVVCASQSHKDT